MLVKTFKGKNNIKKVIESFDRVQKKGDVVYSFGYEGGFDKILGKDWWKQSTDKAKADFRGIFSLHKFSKKSSSKRTKVKYVKAGKGNIEVAIWNNTVRIFVFDKNPSVVLIEDKTVAKGFKNYWDFMWKQSKN